jgi:DUF3024 family protein
MTDAVADALDVVRLYCAERVPEEIRDEMLIEARRRGKTIAIVELRPPWNPEFGTEWSSTPVAQLRFDPTRAVWTLHAQSRGRWAPHPDTPAAPDVAALLRVLDADPYALFWG